MDKTGPEKQQKLRDLPDESESLYRELLHREFVRLHIENHQLSYQLSLRDEVIRQYEAGIRAQNEAGIRQPGAGQGPPAPEAAESKRTPVSEEAESGKRTPVPNAAQNPPKNPVQGRFPVSDLPPESVTRLSLRRLPTLRLPPTQFPALRIPLRSIFCQPFSSLAKRTLRLLGGRKGAVSESGIFPGNGNRGPEGGNIADNKATLWGSGDPERSGNPAASGDFQPLISILLPVGNPPKEGLRQAVDSLRETIDSVRAQAYEHWQLCISADSLAPVSVHALLQSYANRDSRIGIYLMPPNQGKAAALNFALARGRGEFAGFLEVSDCLKQNALSAVVKLLQHSLPDLIYCDEAVVDADGTVTQQIFRPDWSPDLLFSTNYFSHFGIVKKALAKEIGGFREEFPSAEDYDFFLRYTAKARDIAHIPEILYSRRQNASGGPITGNTPASPGGDDVVQKQAENWSQKALTEALALWGIVGEVEMGFNPAVFRVRRKIIGRPLVSVIIPTKDKAYFLKRCVDSILNRTLWPKYEILIVNNNSEEEITKQYFRRLEGEPRVKVAAYDQPFNYSAINNWAEQFTRGEHLLFLNNDTEVISPEWMSAMLEHSQRPEVGAVGAKLLTVDGRIQHAGVIIGLGGVADHGQRGAPGDAAGYGRYLQLIRNYSAVTGACMMTPRRVFERVGGFDEINLPVTFSDVDLCLRVRELGLLVVYTPYAELFHYESLSRGYLIDPRESSYMHKRWGRVFAEGDPYYNRNLPLTGPGYQL